MTGPPVMNMLWSYVYARQTQELGKFLGGLGVPRLRVFADSGAHSARTLGLHLDIDEYGQWLTKWHDWFTIYCNLDVIGGPEATARNQKHLEERYGLHPMPVFHTGEPFQVLERMIDEGYTYIALGKLLGNSVKALRPWLAKAFRISDGRAVFHGFGMTVWSLLREFPFYSVDSSSWGSGVRYGNMRLFHAGQWKIIMLRDRDDVMNNRAMLDAYHIPYRALTGEGYDRDLVAGACAAATYRAAAWLRERHGPILLPPGRGYPPPTQVHQVAGNAGDEGLHYYLADTATKGHQLNALGTTRVMPACESAGVYTYLAEGSTAGHVRHAAGMTMNDGVVVEADADPGLHSYLSIGPTGMHKAHAGGLHHLSPGKVLPPGDPGLLTYLATTGTNAHTQHAGGVATEGA